MGSGESTTRKVSFGVDDEDRVRILRGVKLSDDVLQRMRGVANIAPERTSSSTSSMQKDTGASHSASPSSRTHRDQQSTQGNTSKPTSYATEEQRRYEWQQAVLKEELAKVAQREREEMTKAMTREKQHTREEAEKTKQLAQQLEKKDSQLKALDAFYKEQLAQLEKRNLERYEQSKEQFHQAASNMEVNIRNGKMERTSEEVWRYKIEGKRMCALSQLKSCQGPGLAIQTQCVLACRLRFCPAIGIAETRL
uniref:MICOS complex subunit MIC25 n=1 Tax=Anabas testudineus TaxID=64144 RepID=A0A7N6A6W7_ANATE